MRKKIKDEELNVIGSIPYSTNIFDADFGISSKGEILELSKSAQQRGLIVVKRRIRNLEAGIRMYLIHILSRYLETWRIIQGTEVEFLGQLEEIDLWKKKLSETLNILKKQSPVKDLEKIIEEVEKDKEKKLDILLKERKKKDINIGKWALRKAKILLQEKKRIKEILEFLFVEFLKLYNIVKETPHINSLFTEFIFGESYQNLKGEKLNSIKEHFLDYPDDLKKIKEIRKLLSKLEKEDKDFKFKKIVKEIIDKMTPLIEGPLEYAIGKEKFVIERGVVKCQK